MSQCLHRPYTTTPPLGSPNPRDLWKWMENWEIKTGGQMLAIPHNGNLPSVGNTIDVKTATWTNTIGSAELVSIWKDPDFNPAAKAFYYARVIEIPTVRWTTYDAVRFGEEIVQGAPSTLQERAYTSPIWYEPAQ